MIKAGVIFQLYLEILNELMDSRHDVGWQKTVPKGQEADELLQLTSDFIYVVVLSLRYHTLRGMVVEPLYRKSMDNIGRLSPLLSEEHRLV